MAERNVASHNGVDGIRLGNAAPSGLRCHLEGNQAEDNPCGIDFLNGPTHSYRNSLLRGNTTSVCGATGNLDAASAQEILTILSKLNKDFGKTVVLVTHDPHAAQFATKVHHLEKGELVAAMPA